MMQISDNIRGALYMAGSMAAFTVNDAFMKALSDEMPMFQALFLRGVGVIIFLTLLCWGLGQLRFDIGRRDWGRLALRSIGEIGGAYFFITALFNMPIGNLSAILQALPLTVSLAGALFLGEALGWRRLVAILVGFIGVLLIVKPGAEGFNFYALYGLATVACVTLRDLSVRGMSSSVPSTLIALIAGIGVTIFSGVLSMFVEWMPMTEKGTLQLAGSMAFLVIGYITSVAAMRTGEIAFIAPFRYTSLLVALVLGYLVFDDFPERLTLVGAAIVVATGLFTLYREARLKRKITLGIGRLR